MEFLDNRLLIGAVAVTLGYILFRIMVAGSRNAEVYERQVEKILNSDEYKVKGRFE